MKFAVLAATAAIAAAANPQVCIYTDSACATPVPVVPGVIDAKCLSPALNACQKAPVAMLPWSYKLTMNGDKVVFTRYTDGACSAASDMTQSGKSGQCLGPVAEMMSIKAFVAIKFDAAPKPTTVAPIKPTTVAPIKPTTVAPIKPTSEAPIKPTSEAPIEPTSEAPIMPTTEAPMPTTEAPKPTTEVPTAEPTAVYEEAVVPVNRVMAVQQAAKTNSAGAATPGFIAVVAAVAALLL